MGSGGLYPRPEDYARQNRKTRPIKRKKKVTEKEHLELYLKENKGKSYEIKKASEL